MEVKNKIRVYDDGVIIKFWEYIFRILGKISIFNCVRLFKKKITYQFVEKWVMFNLFLAILSSLTIYLLKFKAVSIILSVYGLLRVFEIIIYQINVLLFDPYRANVKGKIYKIKSPTRIVILLLHNYIEIIFWYSVFYLTTILFLNFNFEYNWSYYLRSSVLCFTTFDSSIFKGISIPRILSTIAFWEVISGIIMTLISLARFIGMLPEVEHIEDL